MRAVIDSNIFVSGLLSPSGPSRKIFLSLKQNSFKLLISDILFEELKYVLERPRFHALINGEEAKQALLFIKYHGIFIKPRKQITICRDIKDDKVLECAIEGQADIVVTGDKDLLVLKSFRSIPIIKPKEFLIHLNK